MINGQIINSNLKMVSLGCLDKRFEYICKIWWLALNFEQNIYDFDIIKYMNYLMYLIKVKIKSIIRCILVNSGRNNKKASFSSQNCTHFTIKRQNSNNSQSQGLNTMASLYYNRKLRCKKSVISKISKNFSSRLSFYYLSIVGRCKL